MTCTCSLNDDTEEDMQIHKNAGMEREERSRVRDFWAKIQAGSSVMSVSQSVSHVD
jgi:hypothetical protein